ncbi:C4-dicarboxylate ABC transporter permease [Candidatus Epulonipiscium fishelsonii]|uniref:C4-dicarboxylate ABC transporter permease n=1 Tax=Candidatus Epulonipiscium fishelsonii TaxID=77094 RepID=A0ACC8X908_9FIRM|nr:C4-dicarboxylate ABC transporter permease [Epulopiscium sp. SCG-B05WGA-EpuloA1]ONI38539.1 C4-dicarboxylate ABC transporter permease [Epulopiscium sp. SCG-B11WGA-EpuloA1]
MVGLLFGSFLVLLALNVPVAFSLALSSFAYFIIADMPITMFTQRFFSGLDVFTLLCIPGFILAGNLMNLGGITEKLINFCNKCVGHITGGLAIANVASSMLFAGISGTALADTVSVGGVLIPAMKDDGYDADFSCAVTAASSCVGPIIPPSMPMIMAATLSGLSVSKLFLAGMLPGILMGLGMMLVCVIISKKRNYPKAEKRATFKEILIASKESIWAILMTVIILLGIIGGIVTPTEASILAVMYGIFVGFFIYKKLTIKTLLLAMKQTAVSSSAVMALVGFANIFAYILSKEQIPQLIAQTMLSITDNKYIILILVNLLLLFVGMFMETIAAILILFPVLLGVVTAVGVDPIQFGVIAVLNLVLGLCTPPVGVCLFAAANIGKEKLTNVIRELTPFLVSNFIVLGLVTFVPAITVGFANLILGI